MASSSSSKLLVILLLSSVAAAAVLVVGADITGGEADDRYAAAACEPGGGVPKDPLPGCRAYLLRRCGGGGDRRPPGLKARCCHQLQEVAAACRCEALRAMVEVLVDEEEAPPGCRKGALSAMAARLPARDECDLETSVAGAGDGGDDDGEARRRCRKVVIN